MQVNFNSHNNANNFGMAAKIENLSRVTRKVGPELENALAEAVPDLNLLGQSANIRIKAVRNSKNPDLDGFVVKVAHNPESKWDAFLKILKPEKALRGFVCKGDTVHEGESMSKLLVKLVKDMIYNLE